MERLFWDFGFSKTRRHPARDITCFEQNDIHFLLNAEKRGFAAGFASKHGPAICSMGWRVDDPAQALREATKRGAREADGADLDHPYPAIYGIGDSLIYFIGAPSGPSIYERDFVALDAPRLQPDKGFLRVDHLTNNVPAGEREKWTAFYKDVFGFTEVRYFDIKGAKTGLTSLALRSPDGSFCIPINQPKDDRDQIAEYLREYNGPGVQHLAFLTEGHPRLARPVEGLLDRDAQYRRRLLPGRVRSGAQRPARIARGSRNTRFWSMATRRVICSRSSRRTSSDRSSSR
jgi:4-hydroxyphenylpyruvate dioxygenase